MAIPPPPAPSLQHVSKVRAIGIGPALAVALPHLAAFGVMMNTEPGAMPRLFFLLSWALLNATLLVVLRRPALSAALSLAMLTLLVLLSQFKHDVMQMTVNFVDLMIIDRDSVAFLFTLMPGLTWTVVAAIPVAIGAGIALWRFDPFRVRRLGAAAAALSCLVGLVTLEAVIPDDPWEGFLRGGYVSKFARSGIAAVSEFRQHGLLQSDAAVAERLKLPLEDACHPAGRRPHIILIHDESSFDIRQAQGIKVPDGYGSHFLSADGKARKFVVETSGGGSWATEYNVLAGLSSRSFGRFSYFVTRIAAGRVERGLPLALARCGYSTMSLYPAQGAFMSARQFHTSTGIQRFYDARELGAKGLEPDRFFYDNTIRLMAQEKPGKPIFAYVYLAANHFPWEHRPRPDLTPAWRDPGNAPKIDEYLRRQKMSADDYAEFVARLKKQFPGEPFLIVRYGDHQPEFSSTILQPILDDAATARQFAVFDPRYFTTYYAIDAINFKPATAGAFDSVDAPYLPVVVQEAAGIPLDPSFDEQKRMMIRCKGVFYACKHGAEARRLNRLLIDAGYIKSL